MLAYRHAFHAGNHADVLKHIVLGLVLEHLNLKEKGWRFVDTHAGAGGYALSSPYAQKRAEYQDGIARLWGRDDLPADVAAYVARVRAFNAPHGELRQYPGSPMLVRAQMRAQDQMRLYELHPTDERILASAFEGDKAVQVHRRDGFEALRAQWPPPTRRSLALIDPSYEGEGDYGRVLTLVREGMERFAEGTVIVWYPQVGKIGARELPRRLQAAAPKAWLHARLTLAQPDAQGFGMAGSGVFVINPPFTLHGRLQPLMPWLAAALGQVERPSWQLDQHTV